MDSVLTNPRSERVKAVRALHRRSVRQRTGRFLVDGPQSVREAVRYAAPRVSALYLTAAARQRHEDLVNAAHAGGISVQEVSEDVLALMSQSETPQGLVGVVTHEPTDLETVLAGAPQLLVVLTL